jgi:shikimate dehydrogenase
MRKYGLVGFPLGHSFSKKYFTDKFFSQSISGCSYENYELENLELFDDIVLSDREIVGLNITIPHKTTILKYVNVADDEAVEVGAVNVLKIKYTNGRRIILGFNTDIFGFRESLVPHLTGRYISGAIILGSGGSSKAVEYVLKNLGIDILHVSRRRRGESISYKELTEKILMENKLIINTTPLGMFPDIGTFPDLNYDSLTPDHILFDLVYNPEITSFLKEGMKRGCIIIGGLKMLHLQAEKSWEIWNDSEI